MLHLDSIYTLHQKLKNKEISAVELTQLYLDRIKQKDEAIGSFLHTNADVSLAQAAHADTLIANDEMTMMTGIPVGVKDLFVTNNMPTTCGSRMLENYMSPFNATVVDKLLADGAVNIGKVSMDEFAMGSSNETCYYGPCRNPWDLDYVPGGSSGGSAACVAARLVPAALGTDTGGSIRQPASFCGITGLKPTYGRVSRYGMVAFASSLDQAGPMTFDARDAGILLQSMSGHDPHDATSSKFDVQDYLEGIDKPLSEIVIGIPEEFFTDELDAKAAKLIDDARQVFAKMGVKFKSIHLPNIKYSVPTYYVIAPCEASSNLSRFDGIRYGHRAAGIDDLNELYAQSRCEGFGDEVKRRILIGTFALSSGYYDNYYQKAQKIRQVIRNDYMRAFRSCDLILAPSCPSTAFKLGERIDDPISMYLSDIFTITVNLAGLPAISFPIGMIDNLPYGLQLIGDRFNEKGLIHAAHQYQTQTDWHQQVPQGYGE